MKYIIFIVLLLSACPAYASQASWYSQEACKYNKSDSCPTASGYSLYDLERDGVRFCAMWDVPMYSTWLVTNVENGRSTIVKVFDRGPARRLNRVIDLSKSAFQDIADLSIGVIDVTIKRVVEITRGGSYE